MVKKATEATPNYLLRAERLVRNWTQQEVADRIGAPHNFYISRWEQGTASPSMHYIRQLCELFGKSAQELGLAAGEPDVEPASSPEAAPVPLWHLPYRRNPFFTGREDVLERLHETLTTSGTAAVTQPQAISGLGGIGKTQTALEYAYRSRDEYQAVCWARADSREVLTADLAAIATLLHLPEQHAPDQRRAVEALRRWLGAHDRWLLILDNADDLELVSEFLPTAGRGHVILTTRAQATGLLAQSIDLEQMPPEEGALFLLRRAKLLGRDAPLDSASYAEWTQAKAIAQLLGGLPLALDQAGAYIEETGCGLEGYLTLYKRRRAALLQRRGRLAADHPEPVATTWSLAFEQAGQAHPAAAELLRLCAFLHPDAIPEELISEGAPELGPILQRVGVDPLELDAAIEALRRYSLVRRTPDTHTLAIHRLVQAVIVDQMEEEVQRLWAERVMRTMSLVFPVAEFANWSRCQRYLSHALACAALIEHQEMRFPEAAHLLQRAALYLLYRAQYAQAESLHQQALAICEHVLGAEHPDVAESLYGMGAMYWLQGKYEQAESCHQRALTIREQILGPEHPAVAQSLDSLAALFCVQGKYAQAELLCRRALAIGEQTLGAEHPDLALILNNMGCLYVDLGKYATAEALLQRALTLLEQARGPDHFDVAPILDSLAWLRYTQGRYTQAEPLYRRALAIFEQAVGPEHTHVANVLDDLAFLYTDQGHYAEAEPLFRRALVIQEEARGPAHRWVGRALQRLAKLYYLQGDYAAAEPLLTRSLAIGEQALGAEHPEVALSLDTLALLFLARGQYMHAEQLCRRALRIREQALGAEHPEVATSLSTLAEIDFAQGKCEEAEPLLQRVLSIREQVLGPEHPELARCLEFYARLLRVIGRQGEAEALEARARGVRATSPATQ